MPKPHEVKVWGNDTKEMWSYGDTIVIPDDYAYVRCGDVYITRGIKRMSGDRDATIYAKMISDGVHSSVVGYYNPRDIVEAVQEKAKASEERREKARKRREERFVSKARERILELYPLIPSDDLKSVLESFRVRSGRVGRAGDLDLDDRIHKAVVAHVRHHHTDYEDQLNRANEKALKSWEFRDGDDYYEHKHKREMFKEAMSDARERIREEIHSRIDAILEEWSSGCDNDPSNRSQ